MNIHNNKMEHEKLIEAVRMRPILYESNRRSYKDAGMKAAMRREIAAELGVTGKRRIFILYK